MTAQWALDMAGQREELPLEAVADVVLDRFAEGAATPPEVPRLAALAGALRERAATAVVETHLRELSHSGYLRGAVVCLAAAIKRKTRPDVALVLARELMDAFAPELGVQLARAVLALPMVDAARREPGSPYTTANLLLGEALLEGGDVQGALRHFEAVLSVDVDHTRALRGWGAAVRALERRGIPSEHRSRGLALLDGLEELELQMGMGLDRYDIGRPLGRGRHAVVYQAYDRHVGRDVAIKRLLAPSARSDAIPGRVLESRFFTEARTLSRVRSPHVVAILDVQPSHRFIALELCRGGNLRLAIRRGLVGPADLARVGHQLRFALRAVHAAHAIHRDVKPANILVREPREGSPIALADFGLAVHSDPTVANPNAGTLRYLAPELRRGGAQASPASDRFSAGVVLLELARAPLALPAEFDRIEFGAGFEVAELIPDDLPTPWPTTLRKLLSVDPDARQW